MIKKFYFWNENGDEQLNKINQFLYSKNIKKNDIISISVVDNGVWLYYWENQYDSENIL